MYNTLVSAVFLMLFTLHSQALPLPTSKQLPSLAPMLERVNPAVVNIATYSTRQTRDNPLLNDPYFRRFFNIPEQ